MNMLMLFKSVISGTTEAYCVKCRETRKVIKVGTFQNQTRKGIINRQVGTCTVCQCRTSTILSKSRAAS